MKVFLKVFLLLLSINVYADVVVEVSANREDFNNKDLKYIKEKLLEQAKLEAAKKLFGEAIQTQLEIKNDEVVKDLVVAQKGGIVHIKGDLDFHNGKRFGDLALKLKAFATQEDIVAMKPHNIVLNNFKFTNKDLTLVELKEEAKKAFLVEAIAQKKPTIKMSKTPYEDAKKLIFSSNITSMKFHEDWMAYSVSGVVEYVPLFVRKSELDEQNVIHHFKEEVVVKKGIASLSIVSAKKAFVYENIKYKNGFIFNKKVIKKLKKFDKAGAIELQLNAKLLVPKDIMQENVVVKINNAPYSMNIGGDAYYELWINNTKLEEEQVETTVIHNQEYKYINFSCYASTDTKGDFAMFKELVLQNLQNLTFEVSDDEVTKPLQVAIVELKAKDEKYLLKTHLNLITNESKEFTLTHSMQGMRFSKDLVKTIEKNDKNGAQTLVITTKLLVPNEIKSEVVSVVVNGAPFSINHNDNAHYTISLNAKEMQTSKESGIKIVSKNNHRFINVTIRIATDSSHDYNSLSRYVLSYLHSLNFSMSDEDEEEFYTVVPFI